MQATSAPRLNPPFLTGNDAHQGRFAAAIGADQTHALAGIESKSDFV
jgi:hypothetical protein